MSEPIVIALIGMVGLIGAAFVSAIPVFLQLRSMKQENTKEHLEGREAVKEALAASEERILDRVGAVETKFDNHLVWHAEQAAPRS